MLSHMFVLLAVYVRDDYAAMMMDGHSLEYGCEMANRTAQANENGCRDSDAGLQRATAVRIAERRCGAEADGGRRSAR